MITLTRQKQLYEIKNNIELILENRIPGFSSFKKELTGKWGHEFVKILREGFKTQLKDLKELTDFRLLIVVDNNFIFSQIRWLLEKKAPVESSLAYKLINSDFIDVLAPPKLKDELFEKIELKLSDNTELATIYANTLINKIKLEEAPFACDHKKANDLIGDGQMFYDKDHCKKDEDDVAYLALAFYRKTHAIISFDKIFNLQSDSKVWDMCDARSVMTTYNEGFISICCLSTLPTIGRFIWDTISIAFYTLIDLIIELIATAAYIIQNVWEGMNKIPKEVSVITALLLIFSDTARDIAKQSGQLILKQVKELIAGVKKFIEYIISLLKEMYENCKPLGLVALQLISSMIFSVGVMYEEIQAIEKLRVKG